MQCKLIVCLLTACLGASAQTAPQSTHQPPAQSKPVNVSGSWNLKALIKEPGTEGGIVEAYPMKLKQSGAEVVGVLNESFPIRGTVVGSRLTLTIKESPIEGFDNVIYQCPAANAKSLQGTIRAPLAGTWTAIRTGDVPANFVAPDYGSEGTVSRQVNAKPKQDSDPNEPHDSAASSAQTPAGNQTPPPPRVKISADAAAGMLLQKNDPVYPPLAKAARISGTVVLQVVISTDGIIENLHVVSGPAMLQDAAIDAVKTWRYRPYLLGDKPAEVETSVNVIFTLGR